MHMHTYIYDIHTHHTHTHTHTHRLWCVWGGGFRRSRPLRQRKRHNREKLAEILWAAVCGCGLGQVFDPKSEPLHLKS